MLYILDRFEGGLAVIEASEGGAVNWLHLPRHALPENAREGDVLLREGESWRVDEAAAQARREALRARFASLGKKTEK